MKKFLIILVIGWGLLLGRGSQRVGAVSCQGSFTCTVWDPVLEVCTTVDQTEIDCVQDGNACVWQYDCNKCAAHGSDCYDADNPSATPVPPGGGGAGACANMNQPYCSWGTCGGGKVCVSTGTTGCGCANGKTCADYVIPVKDLKAVRSFAQQQG